MEADILSNMRFLNKKKSLPQNPNPSLQIRGIRGGMEADILSNMHFLNKKKSLPQNPNPSLQIRGIRGGMEADIFSNMRFLNKKKIAPPKSKSEPPNPRARISRIAIREIRRIRGGMEAEFSQSRLGLLIRVGIAKIPLPDGSGIFAIPTRITNPSRDCQNSASRWKRNFRNPDSDY